MQALNQEPRDSATEVGPPSEVPDEMPLTSDPKVVFLGGLFVLASLAAVYVAADILLPLVLAFVLKLLLQPAMRGLERLRVPRILAALLLIVAAGLFVRTIGNLRRVNTGFATDHLLAFDLNRGKTGRKCAACHHVLRSDRVCRRIEVDQISRPDVDRTYTKAE